MATDSVSSEDGEFGWELVDKGMGSVCIWRKLLSSMLMSEKLDTKGSSSGFNMEVAVTELSTDARQV